MINQRLSDVSAGPKAVHLHVDSTHLSSGNSAEFSNGEDGDEALNKSLHLPGPRSAAAMASRLLRPRRRTCSSSSIVSNNDVEPIIRLKSGHKTVYTKGRPPWYDFQGGLLVEPFIIGICGGSASGKTTVAKNIIKSLGVPWVTLLSMDSFYKALTPAQHQAAENNDYNFDHPDAFDFSLLLATIQRLKEGKKVEVPVYNFVTHCRQEKTVSMYGANVLIFEGILAFHCPRIVDVLDMKIFVDADSDIRLCRRLTRDISQRGRDLNSVLQQYNRFVKPAFDYYIAPTMVHADIIVPRGGQNEVAIDLIVHNVQTQLDKRGTKFRDKLARANSISLDIDDTVNMSSSSYPPSLYVLPTTPQIQGLHTFVRNRETNRDEFIFYSKRLMRLVIEYCVSLLPYESIVVNTPKGLPYQGKRCLARYICGVSILRAGETMEAALTQVCRNVRVGKILIQTSEESDEPELYYLRLPKDIEKFSVILMDATVATGAAAMMAIRVLLDHDVPEENIYLVSILMAQNGVNSIAYAFPGVKIVTTAVDPCLSPIYHVLPGMGNFGDRFFGTEPLSVPVQCIPSRGNK